ncbi:hypothetical protein CSOJ01_04134 [Colletotrichum sojae]|uniref:Uncharacterized protein n=1 Tax=Colletotrichum sojae TaxID=2175907 RepID=A0A8H6JK18_9PEZI|nr:hypothetical protein CSOJ01_04134 [Colletotrichum sojae]
MFPDPATDSGRTAWNTRTPSPATRIPGVPLAPGVLGSSGLHHSGDKSTGRFPERWPAPSSDGSGGGRPGAGAEECGGHAAPASPAAGTTWLRSRAPDRMSAIEANAAGRVVQHV